MVNLLLENYISLFKGPLEKKEQFYLSNIKDYLT